jgi:hypothetical protein
MRRFLWIIWIWVMFIWNLGTVIAVAAMHGTVLMFWYTNLGFAMSVSLILREYREDRESV